ncbi:MAG: hypothetical protein JXA54_10440 [Candidatus Heimdallarchaeota archaeon]|nr:hypothetical protein [Candidatus Heimdallarchaeota archaeon]
MIDIKTILLEFFEDEAAEARVVIEKIKDISLDHRLTKETRTVLELANHIAQIPRIDIGIYSKELDSGEKAHKMELELTRQTIDEILKVYDEGCKYLKNYFVKMTNEDFTKKCFVPFYEPNTSPKAWSYFLPKLTTHITMHKGILWSYLKSANAKVNMFTYYGSKD